MKNISNLGFKEIKQDYYDLWRKISISKRKKIPYLIILMLLTAIAEIINLGAVIPFLTLIEQPEKIWGNNIVRSIALIFNWQKASDLLIPICLGFGILVLMTALIRLFTLYISINLSNQIGNELSIKSYSSIINRPYSVHISSNSSKSITGISSEIDVVVRTITSIFQLITSTFVSLGIIFTLFYLAPINTIILALLLLTGYIISVLIGEK